MLTWLTELSTYFSPLNLFRYLTFRTIGATGTAALFVFFFGPGIIAALRLKQGKGQPIRTDGPQSHLLTKKGTPTMGGLMILSGLVVSTLLWANLRSPYVWITLLVTLGFGMIGFYDDYLKVTRQSHAGFSGRARLALEALIAVVACWAMTAVGPANTTGLALPFINGYVVDLGIFFIAFGAFIIVGFGNAVNLTDGLDGLAIVPVIVAMGTFGVIAYCTGNLLYASYLGINHVPQTGELLVVAGAVAGAGIGFLWFNAPPSADLHGRHRLAGAGRPHRHGGGRHQARDRSPHRRRAVRRRGPLGDRPGRLLQADRQAGVPHGADPPSFRAARLVGAADRHAILDHLLHPRPPGSLDPEGALTP